MSGTEGVSCTEAYGDAGAEHGEGDDYRHDMGGVQGDSKGGTAEDHQAAVAERGLDPTDGETDRNRTGSDTKSLILKFRIKN